MGVLLLSMQNIASSEVLFSNDIESGTLNNIFFDVNTFDGVTVDISSDFAHSGTKSIKIGYPVDEAGLQIQIAPFTSTPTLFTRKYEYYAPGWEGNWPVGLKTGRYFSKPDFTTTGGYAYMSEKLIWQGYDSPCNEDYAKGMNNAIYNLDLVSWYGSTKLFGNGLPYIRTGHWYKFETWIVMNSAVDATDGVLKIWVDNNLVYSKTNVVWRSSSRGTPNGAGWQSMWFGGNYSGAVCGAPSQTLYRYIDDLYVSTTLDLDVRPNPPTLY